LILESATARSKFHDKVNVPREGGKGTTGGAGTPILETGGEKTSWKTNRTVYSKEMGGERALRQKRTASGKRVACRHREKRRLTSDNKGRLENKVARAPAR